jgi:hypothetical protein
VVVYVPRCVQNESESLGLKALEDFDVGIGGGPPYVHMGLSTALYRRSMFLLIVLIFRVASAFVSLLG